MGKKDKEKKKGKGAAKTAEKTEKKQKTKVKKELAAKGKNCELNINSGLYYHEQFSIQTSKNRRCCILFITVPSSSLFSSPFRLQNCQDLVACVLVLFGLEDVSV